MSSSGTPSPLAYMKPRLRCAKGISLFGGLAEPVRGLGIILGYTVTQGVHGAEPDLRHDISLFGSFFNCIEIIIRRKQRALRGRIQHQYHSNRSL